MSEEAKVEPYTSGMFVGTRSHLALWLWGAQAITALVACLYVYLLRISIPHCGDQCDFSGIQRTCEFYVWSTVAVVLLSGALLVLARRARFSWLIPSAGIVLVVVGAVVATHITNLAMGLS